jgi:hypothetical protein
MGQMKRIAMINEESFWEIASEYLYIAEDWDDYNRDYMLEHRHLVDHLNEDLEAELESLWHNQ